MMKNEFEALAMRGNEQITCELYNAIELAYIDSDADENKQAFVNRVFEGKINTADTILRKHIGNECASYRVEYAARGIDMTPAQLAKIDEQIAVQSRVAASLPHPF